MNTPILFIIFNRPDTSTQVFDVIRSIRPARLYIAADGPRDDRPDELRTCQEARRVVEVIDWPCEVSRLYRDKNLGCKLAVSSAITWFFENVEEGIILEDDVIPDPSFFSYCEELLVRYRGNSRIMHISGNSFQKGIQRGPASYYFSHLGHVWGWATWRRAWALYDLSMKDFPALQRSHLKALLDPAEEIVDYWMFNLEKTWRGEIDTWDYQWVFSLWINGGLSITPQVNLVKNIGFDNRATHTKAQDHPDALLQKGIIGLLTHPTIVIRDAEADLFTLRNHTRIMAPAGDTIVDKLKRAIRRQWRTNRGK